MAELVGALARKSPGSQVASVAEGLRLAAAGRLDEARSCYEKILAADPRNADVCNNLGVLHLQRGDVAAGAAMFDRAFKLKPQDAQVRFNNVRASVAHGAALWSQRQYGEAIAAFRRALHCDPGNAVALVNLINALGRTGCRAERSDFVADTSAPAGTHVLIACMPKSGSSFLKEALHCLTGWPDAGFSYAYFQNEQELYLPYLVAVDRLNTVTQQHCRATVANVQILQGFDIRPVVLVRSLPDVVMSLVDFYDGGAVVNTFFASDWQALSADAKRDLIVDHVMPWYVSFYASWQHAAAAKRLDCLFVRYEDMIADKAATLIRIADFLGLAKSADECRAAVAKAEGDRSKIRFNRGVAGRGAATLTADQQARLRRLADPYRSIDFTPVGL